MSGSRIIKVNALTRVEGEGGLHVRVKGNVIEEVQLAIYEPPRFFEAFLRGRPLEEVPVTITPEAVAVAIVPPLPPTRNWLGECPSCCCC